METAVGIRELKARLSAYLQRVKAGNTLTITEHGKPIGRIVPLGQTTKEEKLRKMIESGFADWSGHTLEPLDEDLVELEPGANITLAQIVSENRN
jgi:prevent-host-death family protein